MGYGGRILQPSHGEEATNAVDRRGSALAGAGQSCCPQRRIIGDATCRVGQDAVHEFVARSTPSCMIWPPTVWFTLLCNAVTCYK